MVLTNISDNNIGGIDLVNPNTQTLVCSGSAMWMMMMLLLMMVRKHRWNKYNKNRARTGAREVARRGELQKR
jgi:hypothetical protein